MLRPKVCAIIPANRKRMVAIDQGTCLCMGAKGALAEYFGYFRRFMSTGVLPRPRSRSSIRKAYAAMHKVA